MLEWLAASTGVELGKLVLEQVLNLSKPALESYVQDFLKNCLDSGVARLNASTLKAPVAEAIGCFLKRFVRELQINNVPDTSIEHHYKNTIKRFVKDKGVSSILGKAFEKDCRRIDYKQLERIWMQQYEVAGWKFPTEEFDWRGVSKEYVHEVKGIVKANAELRSLLDTELLQGIARNTTQLSPGFDLNTYRESLQSSYGYLKLYTLDSTDRVDTIKLWAMFIEQTVREALPPLRYELPSDLKHKLLKTGELEDDLSPEALEDYQHEYFQQPVRKVLEAIADSQHAVVLGDPGSGKSSLLQYMALKWVEDKTETLPLLIELREFAIDSSTNFLEFLHRGRGVDWQFDQKQLHQHLRDVPTLVMFDGLDEVFDRATQVIVIDDIVRFSQQYPKAQIVVTSRIIGYNPERLQHSGFRHFTIQSLSTDEIHEFIDRWYDLSMGGDPDKTLLKQRLEDAIINSQSIANLADNPLLITMMALLNRRQELPRDRAELYEQASRILLYHWDVDHKRLQIPMNAIGRREKQKMLCLTAYEMQAGEEGLKGNLIGIDRLVQVITNYLRNQGFNEPREKTNLLIHQLRERNFILCYRGADTYGFVHRTFLEYFCAIEITNRFENQRILTFEQLRDEVFGQHWQNESWHEVLQLICGILNETFSIKLIDYLIDRKDSENDSKEILIASKCFAELKNQSKAKDTYSRLLSRILENRGSFSWGTDGGNNKPTKPIFSSNTSQALIAILDSWKNQSDTLSWIEENIEICMQSDAYESGDVAAVMVQKLARIKTGSDENFIFLKACVSSSKNYIVQATALCELVGQYEHHTNMFSILEECALLNEEHFVRWIAVNELSRIWKENTKVFEIVCHCAMHDPFIRDQRGRRQKLLNPRAVAIGQLIDSYPKHHTTLKILKDKAANDPDWQVRFRAISGISDVWENEADKLFFLVDCALKDPFERDASFNEKNPRQVALLTLLTHYPNHPQTDSLLRERALSDSDENLRVWAQTQLEQRR